MSRHVTRLTSIATFFNPVRPPCGASSCSSQILQSASANIGVYQNLNFLTTRFLTHQAHQHVSVKLATLHKPSTLGVGLLKSGFISHPWRPLQESRIQLRSQAETCWHIGRVQRRFKSDDNKTPWSTQPSGNNKPLSGKENSISKDEHAETSHESHKNLLDRLPHLRRPSKDELLAAASGFWQRVGIRFKWLTIRSIRPFNTDELYALFSWVFLGHVVWIILGTTTFFSIAIFTLNTVFAQETLAEWVGNYLTKSSGCKVVFESAIVPRWGDGVITFRNVFVSRRPGQGKANVSKGSSTTAAAAAAAAARVKEMGGSGTEEQEDTNYTQFDISIDTVNVTLSFAKWFNGKGLLRDVEVKGIRGVIDRTQVHSDPHRDPRSYKHEHHTGDFEIDNFKMDDLLVTMYQPNDFRPFSISIYSCELPKLRKQWLFYDFISANNISGSFDESLFTIHPRQTHGHTNVGVEVAKGDAGAWKKHSRIRVDALSIDHLNRGVEGPLGWIHEGNVDIVADIMFPVDDDGSIAKVMSDFYDRMEATVTKHAYMHSTHHHDTSDHHEERVDAGKDQTNDQRFLIMDLRVHLSDVRASVPLFTKDLSYVNNAFVRPIVAYINSKRSFIPVNCRVVKRVSEFDGSWTIYDSGLMEDLSRETYDAFARDLVDNGARTRRLKKVGLWTIQLAAQALFIGLAGQLA